MAFFHFFSGFLFQRTKNFNAPNLAKKVSSVKPHGLGYEIRIQKKHNIGVQITISCDLGRIPMFSHNICKNAPRPQNGHKVVFLQYKGLFAIPLSI